MSPPACRRQPGRRGVRPRVSAWVCRLQRPMMCPEPGRPPARIFERHGQATNYRRLLDIEGAQGPENVAVLGDEVEVTDQLRGLGRAGATDFLAAISLSAPIPPA